MSNSHPYLMIPLNAVTVTPLHQGTFAEVIRPQRQRGNFKNFSPIHTVEWYAGDAGGWIEIPVISGNSLRGRLRRYAALATMQEIITHVPSDHPGALLIQRLLDPSVILKSHDQSVLRLLFSGGTMGAKSKKGKRESGNGASTIPNPDEPLKVWALRKDLDRSEFELLFPLMPTFGYSDGEKKMRPGALAVTDLVPILAETAEVLCQWEEIEPLIVNDKMLPSWQALTAERWPQTIITRRDPMQDRVVSGEDIPDPEEDSQNSKSQMFVVEEYVPAGQQLLGGIYLHESLTLVERGLLYAALDRLFADGFLGGARTRGYGRVQWQIPTLPDKLEADAAWRDHATTHAETMAQRLVDLFELRKTTSQNAQRTNRNRNRSRANP